MSQYTPDFFPIFENQMYPGVRNQVSIRTIEVTFIILAGIYLEY